MTQNDQPHSPAVEPSRRHFLRGFAVATIASCTAGAGFAFYQQNRYTASAPYAPTAVPTTPPLSIPNGEGAAQAQLKDTWQKLAASEAENLKLKTELDAAKRRIEQLESRATEAEQARGTAVEEIATVENRLEVVKGELVSALENNLVLAGLIKLYEELDEIDLSAPLSSGLNRLQEGWETLWEDVPTFGERVEQAQASLDRYDEDVTLFENARSWISGRIERFGRFQLNLETVLEQTQDAVGPLLDLLWGWFESIVSWLPFRLGENSRRIMENMAEIVSDLPDSRIGLAGEVALPLDRWFEPQPETGKPVIRADLFEPLKGDLIPQARQILQRTADTRDRFDEDLIGSLSPIMAQRKQRENAILRYKQQNEVSLSKIGVRLPKV